MSVVFLEQSAVHYESIGRGRAVVFLHTWMASWRYWVSSMQHIAGSHSAYALDLYGFGDSARNRDAYSIDGQAALLDGFLREMGLDRVAVVGHGLGALVALNFAARNPQNAARLIAVSLPLDPQALASQLQRSSSGSVRDLLVGRSTLADELLPTPSTEQAPASALLPEATAIRAWISSVREANIPLLILHAANDPLFSSSGRDASSILGPNMHQISMDEGGHFPMLDASEPFHRLLLDFLALEPGATPRSLELKEEWRRRVR